MLREFVRVSQQAGQRRRLFTDPAFDLYVWYAGDRPNGFQLVYGDRQKFAFTWLEEGGTSHHEVDGWDNTAYEGTPFLSAGGSMDPAVIPAVLAALGELEPSLQELVRLRLTRPL